MWATYTNNAQLRALWLPAMTVKGDAGQEFVTTQAVKEEEVCMSALQDSHAFFPQLVTGPMVILGFHD